ncbi:assimilatory sulfite reductase (NADPH) flavoprotein subunit [Buchnera aphidicola]|uniref:assimilatory sulfite reductase (NADPH) flavoprotein subunit n=1 Tax=Buchnera aphidicola TaxID=9 RepID=UPI003463E054
MKNNNLFDNALPISASQLNDFKKTISTCSNIQLAWLSGYLWQKANQASNIISNGSKKIDTGNAITIVSASQTGNAKLLAKNLHEFFTKKKIKSNLSSAYDYNFKKIIHAKILILIISTQGEGEPPEEAWSLYQFIMSKKAPKLPSLRYSIFALGDTSYNLFCQAGKDFDKRFNELGAIRLCKRIDADIDYQSYYNKWSKELFHIVNSMKLSPVNTETVSDNKLHSKESISICTKNNPLLAPILTNQKITGRYSNKDVHHIEIDLSHLNVTYQPGDALGVWYRNDINLVKEILQLLSINSLKKIIINNNSMTIMNALEYHFELTINTQSIVKAYADCIGNNFLKNIICDNKKLKEYVINTPLINMIRDYPAKISSEDLISFLRPLTPRLYSISSSQDDVENEVHITVGVVKNLFDGQLHFGGASGYLSQFLKEDDKIKIFIETNNNFRLPLDKNAPIIMIGPGTGIAPFRAFMQQRDIDNAKGKNWIFFGNPSFTEDFLYQVEWQRYIKKGLLTKFNAAWSQDQKNKIYVQDKIRDNAKDIWDWIQNGAFIYVCGNAAKMAKDVERTLINIIIENGGMNMEHACDFLNNLRCNRRYQRDVY